MFVDAIKKIELESEEGKFASLAAIQNRKLRREVTTISRMLHKNIVRYYQAWVEGGEDADTPIVEEAVNENVKVVQAEDDESSDDEASSGWWTNSPTEGVPDNLLEREDDEMVDFSEHSSDGASWVAEDDDTVDMSNPRSMPPRRDSHSASIEDLLAHEYDFQVWLMNTIALCNGLIKPDLTILFVVAFYFRAPCLLGWAFKTKVITVCFQRRNIKLQHRIPNLMKIFGMIQV